jgi:hypothetical protein
MADMVKSVEFIEFSTGSNSYSYDLTMGQDYSNCVPFLTTRVNTNYLDNHTWDCYFSGTTESGVLNFSCYTARTTAYVNCYVVEFDPDEVYVEQGSFNIDSSNTDSVTTSSGFDSSRTFMVHYWKSTEDSYYTRTNCRGRVTGDGSLDFYRTDINSSSLNGHWFLAESKTDKFMVEHIEYTGNGGYVYLSKGYDPLNTFMVGGGAGGNGGLEDRGCIRLYFVHRGVVYLRTADIADVKYMSAQIIEFQEQDKIHVPQSYGVSLGATSTVYNWDREDRMQIPTTSGFSMAIKATPYFDMIWEESGNKRAEASSTIKLDNEYQLSLEKPTHSETTYPSNVFAVDWKGYDTDIGTNASPLDPEHSFVKSVENVRILVEEWQGGKILTKGQDLDNCVIFASQTSSAADTNLSCYLHDVFFSKKANMVCARRLSSGNEGQVDVSVVEFYPDQVRVQSGHFTRYTMSTEYTTAIPQTVDTDKTFLLVKWNNDTGSTYFNYSTVRCRIIDGDTLGFFKFTDTGTTSFTWFLAEDITEDNRCFDVTHITSTNSYSYYDITAGTEYYPVYSTFLLHSYATTDAGNMDRVGFRVWQDFPGKFRINKRDSGTDNYHNLQIVRITRDGRPRSVFYGRTGSQSGGTTDTFTYTEWWTDHEDITVYNPSMITSARVEAEGTDAAKPCAFWTGRITDYENRTIETYHSSDAYTSYSMLYTICWSGYDQEATEDYYLTPTNSLIRSITYKYYEGTSSRPVFFLDDGQDPRNCVPIGTWSAYCTDGRFDRLFKAPTFEYGFGRPYKFVVQCGSGPQDTTEMGFYLLEFDPNQVKVQQGYYSGASGNFTITIEEVNTDKAFLVFYSHCDNWSSDWDIYLIGGRIEDSTTLRFKRYDNSSRVYVSWYVVECLQDQWRVLTDYEDGGQSGYDIYAYLPDKPELSRTMFFASYGRGHVHDDIDRSGLRLLTRHDNVVQFNRHDYIDYISYLNCQAVEFKEDLGVRVVWEDTWCNTSPQVYDTFDDPIPYNEASTIVYNPMANNMARCGGEDSSYASDVFMFQELIDFDSPPVKVQLSKGYSKPTSAYPATGVVEFPDFKKYYFEGYVTESGIPVQREVILRRLNDNVIEDTTTSMSGTGYFYVETTYSGEHYMMCFDDEIEVNYNHLIYGKAFPTVISGCFAHINGLTASGIPIGSPLNAYFG